MFCTFCKHSDTEVIETRVSEDGQSVRRRRFCPKCEKRFTTYERIEELPVLVIKRDGRRERFSRDKLRRGLSIPCEKTLVSADQIEKLISETESELKLRESTEIESKEIGNIVAQKLKKLDKIAYIRFASVFKRFVELEDFKSELKKLT